MDLMDRVAKGKFSSSFDREEIKRSMCYNVIQTKKNEMYHDLSTGTETRLVRIGRWQRKRAFLENEKWKKRESHTTPQKIL